MRQYVIPILAVVVLVLAVLFWSYEKRDEQTVIEPSDERRAACEQFLTVAIFADGEAADEFMEACLRGDPVLPEEMLEEPPISGAEKPDQLIGLGCSVGGCSQQVCGEEGEVEDIVTTCEYREEYACYVHSRCERQQNGQCGWTETDSFTQCLSTFDG